MLAFVRIWLPAVVTLAGIAVMVIGGFDEIALEGGAGIIGAGLAIWGMNLLFRVGLDNDRDRDEEDAARNFLDAHGHWPDEPAPPPPAAPPAPAAGSASSSSSSTSSPAGEPEPRRVTRGSGELPPRRPR